MLRIFRFFCEIHELALLRFHSNFALGQRLAIVHCVKFGIFFDFVSVLFSQMSLSWRRMQTWLLLVCGVLVSLLAIPRIRDRVYYTAEALLRPNRTDWTHLFQHGTDRDFLQATRFTRRVFGLLLDRFAPLWDAGASAWGRPRKIVAHSALGMCLEFLRSHGKQYDLCRPYGVTESTVSRTLDRGLPMLHQVLLEWQFARVQWPNELEFPEFVRLIVQREPLLRHVRPFGFVDGTTFKVDQPGDPLEQNALYSGAKADTYVSSLFVYAPDGTIMWCRLNCPGSWHDSAVAQPLYHLLENANGCIIADSAFPRHGSIEGKILRSYKRNEVSSNPRVAEVQEAAHRVITSLRQSVEWGNRSVFCFSLWFRELFVACCRALVVMQNPQRHLGQIEHGIARRSQKAGQDHRALRSASQSACAIRTSKSDSHSLSLP